MRLKRWRESGRIWRMAAHRCCLPSDSDWEALRIDSTAVRAHLPIKLQQAPQKSRPLSNRSLGWWLNEQDSCGRRCAGTSCALGLQTDAVLANKAYDANALMDSICATGAHVVIAPTCHRLVGPDGDRHLYQDRHWIACFFSRIQEFRTIATRDEKLACHYLSLQNLVCTYSWVNSL